MKLLLDGMPLHSGGGVQVAIALLENLRVQSGVEFIAVLPHNLYSHLPPSLRAECGEGGRLRMLPKRSKLDILLAAGRLRRIEREYRPDVVYTVFGPAYFRARAPHLVGFALPNLVYERDGILRAGPATRISDTIRERLLQRANHWVVETETVRGRLAGLLGTSPDRVSVIGNSVNPLLKRFEPEPLPDRPPWRILVPSAYYPHKNLEIVPSVACALRQIAPAEDVEFQLTLEPDSAEWKRIAARAESLGVGGLVRTLGVLQLDDLAEAYARARIVLLPTLREVSTAVYPEAFHFRRPLVTSDLDFARELCGRAACYVPPHDPNAIAGMIHRLLQDPKESEELVNEGERQLARQYPTAEEKFAMQMALLEQVTRSGSMPSVSDPVQGNAQ